MAGLLSDERLLRACAERDMGTVFRLLNLRGVSTRRIAADVGITQGRLYDYMDGKSRVEKLVVFEQIADAFHIPGHLLGLARRSWEPETAAPEHQRGDRPPPDGDDLAAMDHFRRADRQTGGGRLYGAVVRHLSDRVAPRLVDTGDGPQVFAAAAALTEMAGWMARTRRARRPPLHPRPAAGTHLRRSPARRPRGRLQQPPRPPDRRPGGCRAVGPHRPGPRRPRAHRIPALTARLHTMQARALAAAAQHTPAARALEAARRDLQDGPETVHPWLSPFDAAALASESALILRDLNQLDKALTEAEQGVALREAGRARSLALSQITVVDIQVRRRDLDAAVHAAHLLLSTSPTLGSVRVVQQLDDLRRLLEQHKECLPVREYLVRFDDARRARMLLLADLIPPHSGGIPV